MKWRELLHVAVGSEVDYLPAAVSSIVFCLLTMILCVFMHKLSNTLLPSSIKLYALDYFKCLAFCTYPLGYGLTRTYHGHIGFIVIMVPINVASLLIMTQGSVTPVDNFLDFIKGKQPLLKSVLRTIVQIIGAVSAFYLAQQIMMLEFHGDFAGIVSKACTTDLKIPVAVGFLLEMMGTWWDCWWWSQKRSKYPHLDLVILTTNTALIVSLGVHLTGMYMQPALATGYTLGCHGTTVIEHVFVYWLGPFIGGYMAWKSTEKFNIQLFCKEISQEMNNENHHKTQIKKKHSKNNNKKKYY